MAIVGLYGELARLRKILKRMEKKMASTLQDLDNSIAGAAVSANSLQELAEKLATDVHTLVSKMNSPTEADYSAEVASITNISTILNSAVAAMNNADAQANPPFVSPSNPVPLGNDLRPEVAPGAPQPVSQTVTGDDAAAAAAAVASDANTPDSVDRPEDIEMNKSFKNKQR